MRCARIIVILLVVTMVAVSLRHRLRRSALAVMRVAKGTKTVTERVEQFGPAVHERLVPVFRLADAPYPPARLTLVGLKDERKLEVWAPGASGTLVRVKDYPVLGGSGQLGPKLEEGDRQVPEGLYRVEALNPNSMFHLSIKLDYPNAFDWMHARAEGRKNPGSDIFIHGNTASIGCLAMGDTAIEDLFVLVAEAGVERVDVVLAPVDFRSRSMPETETPLPPWTDDLYDRVTTALLALDPWQKVTIDLAPIGDDGLRGPPNGLTAVAYEFCIPATDVAKDEVQSIDPTIRFMCGTAGRIGCTDEQCLCVGSTHQEGFKAVLGNLAALPYVERIDECFFE